MLDRGVIVYQLSLREKGFLTRAAVAVGQPFFYPFHPAVARRSPSSARIAFKARTFSSCSSPTGPWRIYPLDDAGDGGALFADLARAADNRDLVDEALHQDVHENHRPPVRNNRTVEETLAGRLSQGSKGSSGKARKTA